MLVSRSYFKPAEDNYKVLEINVYLDYSNVLKKVSVDLLKSAECSLYVNTPKYPECMRTDKHSLHFPNPCNCWYEGKGETEVWTLRHSTNQNGCWDAFFYS